MVSSTAGYGIPPQDLPVLYFGHGGITPYAQVQRIVLPSCDALRHCEPRLRGRAITDVPMRLTLRPSGELPTPHAARWPHAYRVWKGGRAPCRARSLGHRQGVLDANRYLQGTHHRGTRGKQRDVWKERLPRGSGDASTHEDTVRVGYPMDSLRATRRYPVGAGNWVCSCMGTQEDSDQGDRACTHNVYAFAGAAREFRRCAAAQAH